MAEEKTIKVNEQDFNDAITKLSEYKNTLVSSKETFIAVNESMKKDWTGDGGTAFALSSNVLEARFLERINDLDEEIKALEVAKELLLLKDMDIATAIKNTISSTVSQVTGIIKK